MSVVNVKVCNVSPQKSHAPFRSMKKRGFINRPYRSGKGTDCVSLLASVGVTEWYDVVFNSEELIGTTEYLTLYSRCRRNRCRCNRV